MCAIRKTGLRWMFPLIAFFCATTCIAAQNPDQDSTRDADKDWYTNYFIDTEPKMKTGGCFTAHNVSPLGKGYDGQAEFLKYVLKLKNYETTVNTTGAGLSISYKKSNK